MLEIINKTSQVSLVLSDWFRGEGSLVIRCLTCGNDVVYSPIPSLYFCVEQMIGENITINVKCKPWIPEDAPAEDLLKLTERIGKLAPELRA